MEEGKRIRVLTVRYTTDIQNHEIPLFRGAVIAAMGNEANILYHNHLDDDKFRYSYPLIQYKRIGGKAAIVCVNEGCEFLNQCLLMGDSQMTIGKKSIILRMKHVDAQDLELKVQDSYVKYKLQSWLPLNSENHMAFNQCCTLIDKLELLQNVLRGNIISMAKGLQINIEHQIEVAITDYQKPHTISCKGIDMLSFDIEFMSNTILPDNIGLGKSVSKGHGIVTRIY